MRRKVIKIVFIFLCMGLIFYFSSDNGDASTEKSDGVIVQIAEFFSHRKLDPEEKEQIIDQYVFVVRKSAHFGIYFILGFLFSSLLKEYSIFAFDNVLYTCFFVFLYACSDEVHQLFVSGRSAEVTDVLLDTFGGFCASWFYLFLYRIRREKHE